MKIALIIPTAMLAAMLAPHSVAAQAQAAQGSATQRSASMAERARRPFYTKKFDLRGLPHYIPEQQVSGTLRISGNNYIGDSPLASWWKEGFNKYQPSVKIEYFLPTAAIAVPSLYLKTADVSMDHEPSFRDYLSHLRIFGYAPTGISIVTGSYDVVGWQNTMAIIVNKANPLTKITMQELDGVFGSTRDGGWVGAKWHPEFKRGSDQDIRTWDQLGLTGEWASKRISVYGRIQHEVPDRSGVLQ